MNKYWHNICKIYKKQREKGIKKYGFVLEDNNNLSDLQRLEHLQEELIDGLMYIEHIKNKLINNQVKEKNASCNRCFFGKCTEDKDKIKCVYFNNILNSYDFCSYFKSKEEPKTICNINGVDCCNCKPACESRRFIK